MGCCRGLQPSALEDHKLPGTFAGRGAIVMRFRFAGAEVLVVLLHLSLGERSRHQQLSYVRSLIEGEAERRRDGRHEQSPEWSAVRFAARRHGAGSGADAKPTYPSWRPALTLDHVLVTPGLTIRSCDVLDCNLSDHRPVAVRISVDDPKRHLQ